MQVKPEIYVSTDIETDGPCPGLNSMLSFASVAFARDGKFLGSFTANLFPLQDARADVKTTEWWMKQPEAWKAVTQNQQYAEAALPAYKDWVLALPGKPVFVAYPAGFDFTFIYYYLKRFADAQPFGFSAIDMKTYAMAKLGTRYTDSTKRNWPKNWFSPDKKHTHVALDDALEQAISFKEMMDYK